MNDINPIDHTNLFGLNTFMSELIKLYHQNIFPSKILLSGPKGLGKATLAYHFINYVLSQDEEYKYDIDNFQINIKNQSYKTVVNKSNLNLITVDLEVGKKKIDIDQIRDLISNLKKSSFNNKPRFVLIDNIEFLNKNSINSLLKVLEEPNSNVYFILINNNKRILSTLLSRCINFKISLSNKESLKVANQLLDNRLNEFINDGLINYYTTPGNLYNIVKISKLNEYDLTKLDLKELLKVLIKDYSYKKDNFLKSILFDLIEFYFRKINFTFSSDFYDKYSYFLNKMFKMKRFNLDEESFFIEFEEEILNG